MIKIKLILMGILFPLLSCATELVDLSGHKTTVDELKGKWVLINYWASWCQPCVNEIKQLNHFYQSKDKDVELFAVNFDHVSLAEQQSLVRQLNIRYPSLVNDPGPQLGINAVQGVPATFIFNPKGRLADVLYGGQSVKSLQAALTSLR